MVQSGIQLNLKNQVTDESFQQGMVEEPILLITSERSRMAYAIIDRQRQKAVVLRDYQLISDPGNDPDYLPGFFTQVLEEDELLKELIPAQTIFAVYSPEHSLIPDPLFSKEHIKETLDLTCRLNEDHRYYADSIRSANAQMTYAVTKSLLEETGAHFKEASLYNAASAFIESQLRLNKHESEPIVSVLIRMQELDIVITQGNELRFYNSFHFQTSEDFIYFLLFTMEQLQLNPDQTQVRCYGEIEKISSHWMLGRKYVRNLYLGEKAEGLNYSYVFDRLSPHQYYGLFSQYLCVS